MDETPYQIPKTDASNDANVRKRGAIYLIIKLLVIAGILAILVLTFLLPVVPSARTPASRNACSANLRQIAMALRLYAADYRALPPAFTTDANGKRLHSWRTLILPYIEESQRYKSIDFTKPWDDPVNATARATPVDVYQCPAAALPDGQTNYLAIVTPISCLRPSEPRKLAKITDGASQTLMLIEVDLDHAVPWMSPRDADEGIVMGIGPDSKLAHAGGVMAAFVDGHVLFLSADTSSAQRRALISIAGNDKVELEE